MKDIVRKIDENKMLLIISNEIYENEAILNTSYKYTDKCYLKIDSSDMTTDVYFQIKDEQLDLEKLALNFCNELIDQQVRLNNGREFKLIREELVRKAFNSIKK